MNKKYNVLVVKWSKKDSTKQVVGFANSKGKVDYSPVFFDSLGEARDVFRLTVASNPKLLAAKSTRYIALMGAEDNHIYNQLVCHNK